MTDAAMEAAGWALEKLRYEYSRKPEIGSLNGARVIITAWLAEEDEERIERAAKAIVESTSGPWEYVNDQGKDAARREARAALKALSE